MNIPLQNKKETSIVILCKNEAEGLAEIIASVRQYANEIIVIDGHSTDASLKIAKSLGVAAFSDHGLGKGDGVRVGLAKARGPGIVLIDADGSHDITDIPRMIKIVLQGQADLVVGSRRTGGSMEVKLNLEGLIRSAGVDFMTYLVNLRFGSDLTDILYGFKAIKKSIVAKLNLRSNDFSIDQEIAISCLRNGFKVAQIPSREKKRTWGESKLKTVAGLKLLYKLLLQLFR